MQTQSVSMKEEMFAQWETCLKNVKPFRRKRGKSECEDQKNLAQNSKFFPCYYDQRLCWHHPRGSDLLRAANFHANSDPEKEDIRYMPTRETHS